MNPLSSPRVDRVLVIGLDGATFDLLVPLAGLGVLPNLAALMRDSALAQLRSTRPYITPVAWSTFLTGCGPESHGVLDYRYLDHARRELALNNHTRLRAPTIFECLASAGGHVVSIDLPMTWPPPAKVPGVILGGLDCPGLEAALRPFPQFAQHLSASCPGYSLRTIWKRRPETFDELSHNVAETARQFQARVTAAKVADELVPWQLMIVQFQGLDALQHRAWHLLFPDDSVAASGSSAWVQEARKALRALDQCVGELLDLALRRRAGVVALSDHGFGPFRERINVPALLMRHGWMRPASLVARGASRMARCAWKSRRWLARRRGERTASLPRPLHALLPIDWRRSLCFCAHGDLAGMIYLNDPRRTGAGPLRTERQRAEAESVIIGALAEARHPETAEPLFDEVFSVRRRFDIDPVEHLWPEVLAIPAPGFHTRSKLGCSRDIVSPEPALSGTHRETGVLMVQAPLVRSGHSHAANIADVAPTILSMLGIEPPKTMTGRVLNELLGAAPIPAADRHPKPGATAPSTVSPATALSARDQTVVEARLRALGYLD
ncbi:MAG: alkaline phosphatase family protein [Planctomycetia bacterium]|nr:alkaline phosphatase family protein [Planctomycetia bacterium]